jgi:hypothetical protein
MPFGLLVTVLRNASLGGVSSSQRCLTVMAKISCTARLFFFISVMRNAFVLIILTLAAWLYTRHRKSKSGKYPIKILQTVPRGLKDVGQPVIDRQLLGTLGSELPMATIILLLEHIAIGKCALSFVRCRHQCAQSTNGARFLQRLVVLTTTKSIQTKSWLP